MKSGVVYLEKAASGQGAIMICPQTKAECAHNCSAWMISCKEAVKPPPPTLAEIERLVDAHGETVQALCNFDECGTGNGRPELESEFDAARAALMAAIRAYGRE